MKTIQLNDQELDIIITHCEQMLDVCEDSECEKYERLIEKLSK